MMSEVDKSSQDLCWQQEVQQILHVAITPSFFLEILYLLNKIYNW